VERFTLALMLFVVAFRNLIELSRSEFDFTEGFVLPMSFGWFRGNNVLWTISYVRGLLFSVDNMPNRLSSARFNRHDLRNAGGLAETCFHH
jgi:hypothetical protein